MGRTAEGLPPQTVTRCADLHHMCIGKTLTWSVLGSGAAAGGSSSDMLGAKPDPRADCSACWAYRAGLRQSRDLSGRIVREQRRLPAARLLDTQPPHSLTGRHLTATAVRGRRESISGERRPASAPVRGPRQGRQCRHAHGDGGETPSPASRDPRCGRSADVRRGDGRGTAPRPCSRWWWTRRAWTWRTGGA